MAGKNSRVIVRIREMILHGELAPGERVREVEIASKLGVSSSDPDVSFTPGPDISSQTDIVTMKMSATRTVAHSSFTETKTGRRVGVVTICTKG